MVTPPADPGRLDAVAGRYVVLGLSLGRHDPNYVDAYYGPDSLKAKAAAESLSIAEVRAAAEPLVAVLGDSTPGYADSLVGLRHRYLRAQLGAMAARARIVGGERLPFDGRRKPSTIWCRRTTGRRTSIPCSAGSTASFLDAVHSRSDTNASGIV